MGTDGMAPRPVFCQPSSSMGAVQTGVRMGWMRLKKRDGQMCTCLTSLAYHSKVT
jgi:hypothetical protein